ncbi:MAG: hypothetical protein KF735_14785 [Chelatococcus sp.]|jgi:3-hydroxybutyryl-CoA dehydratase|uniref:MaoC family dehydratase n=1 Tax=unclassified Chelatococcus TaxID=2638111 RepID=UPI001BD05669|nr:MULTISPECIES: MaoC/PaaZ C-terminal domain-containing protein [unclassified Chelatococcus]CAH1652849.1 Acyl dehydratase [Hyphomicrobiales bacterium]MBS7742979.1 hypothetical protein [Chelatococcus sp. HY11]MBX3538909.1 hypothetical protein [Chelatococcus sp.]MBX3541903.1 hypothetical protein [Chelatococcus sp.]MCO5074206.1 hypothetical protein [Chelatococcus sp.]
MTLPVGAAIPPFVIEVSPAAMQSWAIFLKDPNPIHLDAEIVRAKGLGDRVINQGPANVAYIINALAAAFPGCTVKSLAMRFLDNVYGGEIVEAGGTVTAVAIEGDLRITTCDMWLKAADRGAVISGPAVVTQPAS